MPELWCEDQTHKPVHEIGGRLLRFCFLGCNFWWGKFAFRQGRGDEKGRSRTGAHCHAPPRAAGRRKRKARQGSSRSAGAASTKSRPTLELPRVTRQNGPGNSQSGHGQFTK